MGISKRIKKEIKATIKDYINT